VSRKYLGKQSNKILSKDPFSILDPIDRSVEISKYNNLTLAKHGIDIWNAYEFSYLDKDLKSRLNVLEITIPSNSFKTVESKSMKLYLNSFYNHSYVSKKDILNILRLDLSKLCGSSVKVNFKKEFSDAPSALSLIDAKTTFTKSNLLYKFDAFRSLCPVTNQPDWGVIYISSGSNINIQWLNKYLSAFKETGEFHELCIDKIFSAIKNEFNASKLSVYGRFMRRGGIDINPLRSSSAVSIFNNHREFGQ
tara:strand:+ start:3125 stop:3874 length:750 start_codon:yes stop_codon:yes gene_type:complete